MEEEVKKEYLKKILSVLIIVILTGMFVVGGLVFYIAKKNPYNLQACLIASFLKSQATDTDKSVKTSTDEPIKTTETKYDHPLLNVEQEIMLEKTGVKVDELPETISPELEACFTGKLGAERVAEIKAGSSIGSLDVIKGGTCLN